MMRARRGSDSAMLCSTPLLPRKLKLSVAPSTFTCRRRSVVRPKELFSRAYSSFPTRISVRSSSRTTVASSWRRVWSGARRSRSMRSRSRGSTWLNSSMAWNLVRSRASR
jgi:hypothetical protein